MRSIFIVIFIHIMTCCIFFATLNDFVIKTTLNSIDVGAIISLYLLIIALGALSAYPLLSLFKKIKEGIISIISLGVGTIVLLIFTLIIQYDIYILYPLILWLFLYIIGVIVGVQYLRFMYLLQLYSQKEYLGRVMSVFEFIISISIFLGVGIGMILAELLGFKIAFYTTIFLYGIGFIYFTLKRATLTW